ncbi:hypothetical protein ACHHYP_20661 [Achlya hypogyna]|uniref:Survival motor neuron Tudor domain-containing protein n=1 Tax=Achlya hypogyna TaxID=1202772 RepID=A0A1V9YFQ5_ACHHY|nr:hypothetical protein ACHHYP_20661 [Achlya hypogyna]
MVDEQWDDLAILKAFDAAVYKRKNKPTAPKQEPRQASAAPSYHPATPPAHVVGSPASPALSHRSIPGYSHETQYGASGNYPSHSGSQGVFHAPHFEPPYTNYQAPQHQPQAAPAAANDQFAAAYAFAYAQAVTQGAAPSSQFLPQMPRAPQMQFHSPPQCPYGCQHATPSFPNSFGVPTPPVHPDDDLSKLLLSWYQSGYYAGRYKALQEMKASQFRR